ncbi:MAG: 2,3-diphosphoglycerate-dependent phosphoglycerate mutase [Candidatus Levybacteria bacterium]|nr:2,3-diphosphoglycerate-dependent phosphoglycerate mutase [Candidatus Levybacteria bacterium]
MAYLALVRHGQSTYNEKGVWAGKTDVPLTPQGEEEAKKAGEAIADLSFDTAYTSNLIRAKKTLEIIKSTLRNPLLQEIISSAISERDYGDLTGKNKWEMQKELGEGLFMKYRRSWDFPPPHGESLKDVYDRVLPYFKEEILPQLIAGKNILICAHGNSLRALIKYLDNISDENIPKFEIATGEVYLYNLDNNGAIVSKKVRSINQNRGKQ